MARDANMFHGELPLWNESSFPAHPSIKSALLTPGLRGDPAPHPEAPDPLSS